MHYLVTGGAGFIGSHLLEKLLRDGHRVTVLDDLSTGKRENLPTSVTLQVGDITTPGIFDTLVRDVDGCFHLAAIASVQRSVSEPQRTRAVNFEGTKALFDAIRKGKKIIPVVYASSAAVYGNCKIMPIDEDMAPAPISSYGTDKLESEYYAQTSGVPGIGLRFFNVYGERQDPSSPYSGVISIFIDRLKANQPVTIYGDGNQTRDFIYAGDVAGALALSMQKLQAREIDQGVFNVCTGGQATINELAQIIKSLTGSTSAITHAAARAGDIRISQGSGAAAQKQLGFTAVTPLRDGLAKTIGSP
jgi:UDP-glucose 4-epimerase